MPMQRQTSNCIFLFTCRSLDSSTSNWQMFSLSEVILADTASVISVYTLLRIASDAV